MNEILAGNMAFVVRSLQNTVPWKKIVKNGFASIRFIHTNKIIYGVSRSGFEDYEKERASWNVIIPEKFNFASDVLDAWAHKEKVSNCYNCSGIGEFPTMNLLATGAMGVRKIFVRSVSVCVEGGMGGSI